ncbi:glutamate--tRNA ligase, partial [Novacetimonas hansenii]|nr:glutamate--tRNA ligase [Novacetimonas hansenii]
DVVAGEIVPPVMEAEDTPFLLQALEVLPDAPWDDMVWKTWTTAIREVTGRTGRALFHPLRLALTGEDSGPEMRDLLPLMGRERVAGRLRIAAR